MFYTLASRSMSLQLLYCNSWINYLFCFISFQVVIGKLRSDVTTAAESHHHMKAAKALLVIIPLLGITYLITLIPPPDQIGYLIFQHVRAIMLSIQVSGIKFPYLISGYCFLSLNKKEYSFLFNSNFD